MKSTFIPSLVLGLSVASQWLITPARAEEVPVSSGPPAMDRSVDGTYGPAPGGPEAGLPGEDTHGEEGYTRTARDWEREYGGLNTGNRTQDPPGGDRSGLSGIIINFGEAVEAIKRVTGGNPPEPPEGSGVGGWDNQGNPPSDDPGADPPLGQDDFDVDGYGYRVASVREAETSVAGDHRCPNCGRLRVVAPGPQRRHVPPVVLRGCEPSPAGHPNDVGGSLAPLPPPPPGPSHDGLSPAEYEYSAPDDRPFGPAVDPGGAAPVPFLPPEPSDEGLLPADYSALDG